MGEVATPLSTIMSAGDRLPQLSWLLGKLVFHFFHRIDESRTDQRIALSRNC
jgi:hypothetical protein